ncbi:MAG: FkbM family methyltransferase [Cyclobacteriaceae bacterium]|nr:FkbM family methyltransferase [Cyclobacteriaceae bacterium]
MKSVIRTLLRKLGLLNWLRRLRYRYQYRNLISRLRGKDAFDVEFNGVHAQFSVDDPFSAIFFATYFNSSVYEKEGLDILIRHVNTSSTVFDVGANIGYFTCLAGCYCSGGHVYAFEPGYENVRILKRNIDLNALTNTVTEYCAVSDLAGTVKFQNSPVGNAVLKMIETNTHNWDLIPVKSITLDGYCEAQRILPDFVKIDVEGAEMKVLSGMENILAGNVKLLIEIHDKELKEFNSSKEEVLNYLKSFGFTLEMIGNDAKKNLLIFASK